MIQANDPQFQQVLIQLIQVQNELNECAISTCHCETALHDLPTEFAPEVHAHCQSADADIPLHLYHAVLQCRHHEEMKRQHIKLEHDKQVLLNRMHSLQSLVDPTIELNDHLNNERLRLNAFQRTTI